MADGNEYDRRYQALDRRRALANALMLRSLSPQPYQPTMIPGPYGPVVANTALANGITSAASVLGSALMNRGVNAEEQQIESDRQQATADWIGGLDSRLAPGASRAQQLGALLEGYNIGGVPEKLAGAYMQRMFQPEEFDFKDTGSELIQINKATGAPTGLRLPKSATPDAQLHEKGENDRFSGVSGNTNAQIEARRGDIVLQAEEARRTKQTPGAPAVSINYADPASIALRRQELDLAKQKAGATGAEGGGYVVPSGYRAVKMPKPMSPAATMGANEAALAAENMERIITRQQELHADLSKRYGTGILGKGAAWIGEQVGRDPQLDEYMAGQKELVQLGLQVQKGVQTEGDALRQLQASPRISLTTAAHKNLTDRALAQARRTREVNEAAMHGYILDRSSGAPAPANPATKPAGGGVVNFGDLK